MKRMMSSVTYGLSVNKCQRGNFPLQDGYLFKGTRLCVPKCLLRLTIIEERHEGRLGGHFGLTRLLP